MNNRHYTNIVRLKAISNALELLNEEVVFVGGAILALYVDKPLLISEILTMLM